MAHDSKLDRKAVEELLTQVPDTTEAILVGGQALNVWAEIYLDRVPEIARFMPFTSDDVDFFGLTRTAREWAEHLKARVHTGTDADHAVVNSAVLTIPQEGDEDIVIDFLANLEGVISARVKREAVTVEWHKGQRKFRILHPFHCLACAVSNTYARGMRRRDNPRLGPRAVQRIDLAIEVCRAYLRHLLDEWSPEEPEMERPFKLIEYVNHLAQTTSGLAAYQEDGLDLLTVIDPTHKALRGAFREKRWPQIQGEVAKLRETFVPGKATTPRRPTM